MDSSSLERPGGNFVRQTLVFQRDEDAVCENILPSAKDLSAAEHTQCVGALLLHPEGSFHCTFDSILIMCCFFSLITIPFVVSVLDNGSVPTSYVVCDLAIDSMLVIDIFSAFFTSFYDDLECSLGLSTLVLDRKRVCARYFQTTFARDCILSLSLDTIGDLLGAGYTYLIYARLYRFVARALRLHFLHREGRYLFPLNWLRVDAFRSFDGQITFVKFLACVLYVFHVSTCVSVALNVEVEDFENDNYTAVKRYMDAFFRTELLMVGVGRQKTEETDTTWGLMFICFDVLVGSAMVGFLFAQVAEVINRLNMEHREHLVHTTKLRRAMRAMGIDKNLRTKLQMWTEQLWYMYTRSGEAFVEEMFDSDKLNESVKHELVLQVRAEIISQFSCLSMLQEIGSASVYAKVLLAEVCQLLRQRIYLPGDFLCRRRIHATRSHILLTGQCCSDTVIDRSGDLITGRSQTGDNAGRVAGLPGPTSPRKDDVMQNPWMHALRILAPRFCNAQALLYKGTTYFASLVATSNCEVYEVGADAYCDALESFNVTEESRCVVDAFEHELFQTLSTQEVDNLMKAPDNTMKLKSEKPSTPPTSRNTRTTTFQSPDPRMSMRGLEGLPEYTDDDDMGAYPYPSSKPRVSVSGSMRSIGNPTEMQKVRRQQAYMSRISTAQANVPSYPSSSATNANTGARRFSAISNIWSRRSNVSTASIKLGPISRSSGGVAEERLHPAVPSDSSPATISTAETSASDTSFRTPQKENSHHQPRCTAPTMTIEEEKTDSWEPRDAWEVTPSTRSVQAPEAQLSSRRVVVGGVATTHFPRIRVVQPENTAPDQSLMAETQGMRTLLETIVERLDSLEKRVL